MEDFLREKDVDVVFLPHTADTHPTHRAVLYVTLCAIKRLVEKEVFQKVFFLFIFLFCFVLFCFVFVCWFCGLWFIL